MQLSVIAKTILSYPLVRLGMFSKKIHRYSKNGFLILMYHRILPPDQVNWKVQPGMYVHDTTFKMQLKFLKQYFYIVHLSQLNQINERSYQTEGKPLCVLTFDDGWRDFYDYAYPLLKEFDLPATVFLATDFIGSKNLFWTDRVPYLLELIEKFKKNNFSAEPDLTEAIIKIKNLTDSIDLKLEKAIEILKKYPLEKIEKLLDTFSHAADDLNCDLNRVFLSWDEVRKMKESGLIFFGPHTCTHRILTTLKNEEILFELKEAKAKLIEKKVCDEKFIPFCYPNGNYNKKIVQLVQETGYDMAVTTENGWNKKGANPFTLKRIGIHNDMTFTASMFGCKIMNFF